MSKFYFSKLDDERCYTLRDIIEEANNCGLDEIEVSEAKRVTGQGLFYCKQLEDIGESGEYCGVWCSNYSPRNGKNGRCRYSGYCYEPTDKKRIIKIKLWQRLKN
jgi:hypothetical protein